MSKFTPPVFEKGSEAYELYILRLDTAREVQKLRNTYTKKVRKDRKTFRAEGGPPRPTGLDLEVIQKDREWFNALKLRTDKTWFRIVNKVVKDKFYRSKICCLIWWALCEKTKLDGDAWHARFEDYSYELDQDCDWDLVEYALHCIGFSPAKARAMCGENADRTRMKEHREKVFICDRCGATFTGTNLNCNADHPQLKCRSCFHAGFCREV